MVKGRGNNPPTKDAGKWYRHKNCESDFAKTEPREVASITSRMTNPAVNAQHSLTPPTDIFLKRVPAPEPPQVRHTHHRETYRTENPFSRHDNRNDIQKYGEYLDTNSTSRLLGRRLSNLEASNHLHRTEKSFIKHYDRAATDFFYESNYGVSFKPTEETASPPAGISTESSGGRSDSKFQRRFSRVYPQAKSGPSAPSTATTDWIRHNVTAPVTKNQVLLSSIEPLQRHNAWKYSFHKQERVYPRVWGERCEALKASRLESPRRIAQTNRITPRLCMATQA